MHVAIEELHNFTASSCVLSSRQIFKNLFLRHDENVHDDVEKLHNEIRKKKQIEWK